MRSFNLYIIILNKIRLRDYHTKYIILIHLFLYDHQKFVSYL